MVSVIIPIYNCEQYIERCLGSLFQQTLQDIEYIFIDDCSSDNSYYRLKSSLEHYPGVKSNVIIVRHEVNKGVAAARNTGLLYASKKYIGWVDADDRIDPRMFESLYNKAETEKSDIVWTDYFAVYCNGNQLIDQNCIEDRRSCIIAFLEGRLIGSMWNKLFRRDLFVNNNIKFIEGLNMCEDLRANISLFYFANKISYLNEAYYFYYKTLDNSISSKSAIAKNVNQGWVENVRGIVSFLNESDLLIDKLLIDKFKLVPKKNLLVKGQTIESFKLWKSIFPESNYSIQFTNYPFVYKKLALAIEKNCWIVARLWILLKYKILNKGY